MTSLRRKAALSSASGTGGNTSDTAMAIRPTREAWANTSGIMINSPYNRPLSSNANKPVPPTTQQQNSFLRMSSLFRSEDMVRVRLYFDRVAAHDTIDELGTLGVFQFEDLNPHQSAFQRSFTTDVKVCDEIQRGLRFLRVQIEGTENIAVANLQPLSRSGLEVRLDDLGNHVKSLELSLVEMNSHWDALKSQLHSLNELKYVFEKCSGFFGSLGSTTDLGMAINPANSYSSRDTMSNSLFSGKERGMSWFDTFSGDSNFGRNVDRNKFTGGGFKPATATFASLQYVSGVIHREKVLAFERVIFRSTRGNCLLRVFDIEEPVIDPVTKEECFKSVFLVFYSGSEVQNKLAKICAAFSANRYAFPEDPVQQSQAYTDCKHRLDDLYTIIDSTELQRREMLLDISTNISSWENKVAREKAIFHVLNLLNYDTSQKLFIGEGWTASSSVQTIRDALEIGRKRSNAQLPSFLEQKEANRHGISHDSSSGHTPPTFFKLNKFTEVFQSIVESYGVAQYQEVNPAPFTIITFPFLFAVMFGDVGHGIIMALFAYYMIRKEDELNAKKRARSLNEFMSTCFSGRYIILLMGLFSVFTGFIYNDFFALPMHIFGESRWMYTDASKFGCGVDNCVKAAANLPPIQPYNFGFDPIWKHAQNGLIFYNSYKMKLSIILGVCQMTMGICLSYVNARFFKEPIDVWYVFVPQLLFMSSIFGYLVILILLKWMTNWNSAECLNMADAVLNRGVDPSTLHCDPPDLKGILINMFMAPGKVSPKLQLFPGQSTLQLVLLVIALVSVPWMLFCKPFLLRARHERRKQGYKRLEASNENGMKASRDHNGDDNDMDDDGHVSANFDFGDTMVHQMIHTIEFVLGAISNTASYLRLWALSLAHAQLSEVFLEKLLLTALRSGSFVFIVIGFSMWAGLTLGVLMGMESLSAFLHALRLHWVEFQNKFYNLHGSGRKFMPFDYRTLEPAD